MISRPGSQRSIWHYPTLTRSDRTPRPPARYHTTHWETGSLARQETARAASKRRRHLQEQLELSLRYEELLAAQLEAFRRTTALRRALREEENNGTIALSSDSPRRPSTADTKAINLDLKSNSPHPYPPQGRWIRPASTRTFVRTWTRRCSSTTSRPALCSPLSKLPKVCLAPTHTSYPLTGNYRQKITCSTRVHVLIPKLQTADTMRSTKLHRPRRLRPSSNTRGMPPPLQSLRLNFTLEASLLRTYRTMANKPHDRVALRARPTKLAVDKQLFGY